MNAKDLVVKCQAYGVSLASTDHGALRVRPPGVLPDELKHLLQAHKQEVLNLLAPPPARGCYTCQRRRYWQHAETYRWICATCHPPAHVELVEAWHEAPEPAMPWLGVHVRPWTGDI